MCFCFHRNIIKKIAYRTIYFAQLILSMFLKTIPPKLYKVSKIKSEIFIFQIVLK